MFGLPLGNWASPDHIRSHPYQSRSPVRAPVGRRAARHPGKSRMIAHGDWKSVETTGPIRLSTSAASRVFGWSRKSLSDCRLMERSTIFR